MCPLDGRKAERLDWLGVSFGLTHQLLSFWNKAGYRPVYIRQTANETTGEHSSVFLKERFRWSTLIRSFWFFYRKSFSIEKASCWNLQKPLAKDSTYVEDYSKDFKRRFSSLLAFDFAKFQPGTALQILGWKDDQSGSSNLDLRQHFTAYDLERINLYTKGVVDYHLILDLLPNMIRLISTGQLRVLGLR